ncbi:MAG TPA: LysM peptidoglycan-binding domain-containing protein [Gaiellales bacterium]
MRRRTAAIAATALVLAAATPAAARTHYTVRYGDTLTAIARAHGVSLRRLARLNHRRVYAVLPAGTVLVVPGRAAAHPRIYTVRWGDTLSGIAARFGLGLHRLERANGMGRHSILAAGSTIHLSSGSAHGSSSLPGRYRVRPGDTLSGIAARFGIGLHRLAHANGLEVNGLLLAGITLRVPSGAAGPAPIATGPWSVTASIDAWSAHYGVDARLARAIAWQESGFHVNILSSAGAWGPMQVLPGTWTYVEDVLIGHPVARTADGDVRIGVALLHHLIGAFGGDESLAVAAYYQGESSVRDRGMLPVTRWYVADVMALRGRM